jgi:hypothetical protein
MDPPQETPSPEWWDRALGSQYPTGYEVGSARIVSHECSNRTRLRRHRAKIPDIGKSRPETGARRPPKSCRIPASQALRRSCRAAETSQDTSFVSPATSMSCCEERLVDDISQHTRHLPASAKLETCSTSPAKAPSWLVPVRTRSWCGGRAVFGRLPRGRRPGRCRRRRATLS